MFNQIKIELKNLPEDLQCLINKANKAIDEIKNWCKINKLKFEPIDLKLHGAKFYESNYSSFKDDFPLCYRQFSKNHKSFFNEFCNIEYSNMINNLALNYGIDFSDYNYNMGMTSSFYLHNKEIIVFDFAGVPWGTVFENIIKTLGSYAGFVQYYRDGHISLDRTFYFLSREFKTKFNDIYESIEDGLDDMIQCAKNELNYLINNALKDLKQEFKDEFIIYDYINNFKHKQVELFQVFLRDKEEQLKVKKDENEKEELLRLNLIKENIKNKKIANIFSNSNINANDLETIFNYINKKGE